MRLSISFNLSLLTLFIAFSRKTYTDAGKKPVAAVAAVATSHAKLKPW